MNKIKDLMNNISEGKYSPREILLTGTVLFLSGMLLGIFLSPRKHQVIGSHNGNGNYGYVENDDNKKKKL